MNCLQDILCGNRVIIGIRDYADCNIPESGLFLNDLPGINLKTAALVANPEQHTGVQLMKQCLRLSAKKAFNDFPKYTATNFDFNAVLNARKTSPFNDTIIPAAPANRGLVLARWRSEAARIYVQEIYVKADTSGAATVNMIDGSTVTPFAVTLVANQEVTVPIRKWAEAERIRFEMDNTAVGVYSCEMNTYGNSCGSCYGSQSNGQMYSAGWNGTGEDTRCYGIRAMAQIQCNEELIICGLLNRMHFILWYGAGIEFLKYRIETNRLNELSMFTKEEAKELLKTYQTEYVSEWKSFVKNTYNYMRTLKGECFNCNGNVNTTQTP